MLTMITEITESSTEPNFFYLTGIDNIVVWFKYIFWKKNSYRVPDQQNFAK